MKLLVLTEVVEAINDKGQERIDKALAKDNKKLQKGTDKYGYTLEQWEDMGTPIPEDSIFYGKSSSDESEIDEHGYISLKKEELEYLYFEMIVDLKQFSHATDLEDFGALLYLKDGSTIRVDEDTDEIYEQIQYLTQKPTIIQKLKSIFK